MPITSEMCEYFDNLMKTLVTTETLEQQHKSFQDGLMKKIEVKFKEQNDRIEEFESKLAMKQNIIDHLGIRCDDNEQYSRTSCLQIQGLDEDRDRAHYIGKPYMDKKKNKVRAIIVKFRSWKSRTAFHRARSKNHKRFQFQFFSGFNETLL